MCWSPLLGLFCAVANSGTGDRVMTSPDGATWTSQDSASDNYWKSVCWSPTIRMFCAVSETGTKNSVMYSNDGINWHSGYTAFDADEHSGICWSEELGIFCVCTGYGSATRNFMISASTPP